MGLTATNPACGLLDATQNGCGVWAGLGDRAPGAASTDSVMSGLQPPRARQALPGGVRFFAHDAGVSRRCALAGESVAHHRLKLTLASAIRAAGHDASVEAAGPEGRWRADVLSASLEGANRLAWEVQLAAATNADIEEPTARYASEGIGVCRVSDGLAGDRSVAVCKTRRRRWTCSHGHRTCPAGRHGHWEGDRQVPLEEAVVRILNAALLPHTPAGSGGLCGAVHHP